MKLSAWIKTSILLYWAIMPDTIIARNCQTNPVYCKILKLNPKVDTELAYKLSNYLSKYASKHAVDIDIALAIIAQESMFRDVDTGKDSTMFQFNKHTIKAYKIDKLRLQFDLRYATEEYVKLLKRKSEYCQDREAPWACYHSSTKVYYNKYIKDVSRHLIILKGVQVE